MVFKLTTSAGATGVIAVVTVVVVSGSIARVVSAVSIAIGMTTLVSMLVDVEVNVRERAVVLELVGVAKVYVSLRHKVS